MSKANLEIQEGVKYFLSLLYSTFFLFNYEAKRKKVEKRKRKHVIFLRPTGVLTEGLFSATPNLLASLVASLDARLN